MGEATANAYQARRNARVSTFLCDTYFLRQSLTSGNSANNMSGQMHLLPGPAQYPGATLAANGLETCASRTAENEDAELTVPAGRPPIVYRGGPGFDDHWAREPKRPHQEPGRVVDVD